MQLFIRQFNNKIFIIECDEKTTYLKLKNLIENKIGIKNHKFQLSHNGTYLENKYSENSTVIEMEIENEDYLQMKEIFFPKINTYNGEEKK